VFNEILFGFRCDWIHVNIQVDEIIIK